MKIAHNPWERPDQQTAKLSPSAQKKNIILRLSLLGLVVLFSILYAIFS